MQTPIVTITHAEAARWTAEAKLASGAWVTPTPVGSSVAAQDLRPYTVVCAYNGECCTDAHVWAEYVEAVDAAAAATAMRARVAADELDPHDLVVIDGHPDIVGLVTRDGRFKP